MPAGIDPIKLLLVEDSTDDAELVLAALSSSGFDVSAYRVENSAEMREALDEESWDVVLSDFNLPEFSTMEALDILKSSGLDIPFIVVSGCIGEETAVALMKSGAHDFVMKGNLGRLVPALKRELNEAGVRREKRRMELALKRSEARFSAMTNNVPGMVFQYLLGGSKGRFTYVSEGSAAICGLSPSHLASDPDAFMALLSEADTKTFIAARDRSAAALGAWNWEGQILLSGGHVKWINLRATPRRVEDGSLLWDGVLFNITESKQKEEEIRWSRELLRQLSAHRDSVREEERKRIAREIHDELGQALTALKIDVDWLIQRYAQEEKAGQRLRSMSNILAGTVDSVRRIAEHLRPGMLDDLGLAAAIEWQVEQFSERTGIDCELAMNREEFDLDDRIATCVFRIVQEALTNVARHAGADFVHVTVEQENGEIALEVRDNGRGFQENPKKRSYGLLGIKERAKMLGGEVNIASIPGNGASVCVRLPVEAVRQ